MALELTTQDGPGGVAIKLDGEFDLAEASAVESALRRVEEKRPALLVLDLSGLRFMDSSGLRVVLSADKRAREDGRRFAVVAGPEPIQRVFRITRVDQRLEFVDGVDGVTN